MTQSTTETVNAENLILTPEAFKKSEEKAHNSDNNIENSLNYIQRFHYFAHLFGGLKSVMHSRFFSHRPRPFSLSHMITNRCNSDCPYCFWKHHQNDNEMSLGEIQNLYKQAKKEGFMTSIIWGGEPLLRDDLPEICKASQENGMYTKLATNGYYLEDRPDFGKNTDLIFVSIDAIGTRHDELRRTPNLYEKAIRGIETMKRKYPKMRIYLCHCVSSESDGNIIEVANLAKEMGVLLYFVVNKSNQDFDDWKDGNKDELKEYEKSDDQLSEDFKLIKSLKAQGYPIRNSVYFMDYIINKKNHYTCHWPKVTMVVYSDGSVLRCYDRKPIANLRENTLG